MTAIKFGKNHRTKNKVKFGPKLIVCPPIAQHQYNLMEPIHNTDNVLTLLFPYTSFLASVISKIVCQGVFIYFFNRRKFP